MDDEEYMRWMASARLTFNSAVKDLDGGEYSWACFKAHQAAEKALKALLWGVGKPVYGHSLKKLYEEVEKLVGDKQNILEDCLRLDKYYTATRYPDVWHAGVPEEYFSEGEAREGVGRAERILSWVEEKWRLLKKEDV
ncbi:MAG: HEPN domain-containing protein [Candidatus Caldarchaeum sp.]|nr:HEPN domain-containing protein [Candidatus Caldarchaeum sp.]